MTTYLGETIYWVSQNILQICTAFALAHIPRTLMQMQYRFAVILGPPSSIISPLIWIISIYLYFYYKASSFCPPCLLGLCHHCILVNGLLSCIFLLLAWARPVFNPSNIWLVWHSFWLSMSCVIVPLLPIILLSVPLVFLIISVNCCSFPFVSLVLSFSFSNGAISGPPFLP